MNLEELRGQINEINEQMLALFVRRMELSAQVAEVKRSSGGAVYDPVREKQILADAAGKTPPELREYSAALFSLLMELSRAYQQKLLAGEPEREGTWAP